MYASALKVCALAIILLPVGVGCATPKGQTVDERRAYVRDMSQGALSQLYSKRPELESRIKAAPGYGVFSNIGTQIVFVGGGYGYGRVVTNATGRETFMRVANLDLGLGLGVKDFQLVFVFNNAQALEDFINKGWEFGAEAEAAAKYRDTGGRFGDQATVNAIDIYQVTESGLSLAATLKGTKYWFDKSLN